MESIWGRRKWLNMYRKEALVGWLLISPWIAGCLIFFAVPFFRSIYFSLCEYDILSPPKYIGLTNFKNILYHDKLSFHAMRQTFIYTFANVPLTMVATLALALLLNNKLLKGLPFWRTCFYLPAVVPAVATYQIWRLLLTRRGLLSSVIAFFGGERIEWLMNKYTVIPAFLIMNLFYVGGGILLYLGALQGVPTHLYESAEIDGASSWKQFTKITLPMISPIVFFNLVTSIIGNLQVFGQAYVMTSGWQGTGDILWGAPGHTTYFFYLHLFKSAFIDYRFGYASALAWILFLVTLAFSALIFKSSAAWVFYVYTRKGR